MSEIRFGYRFVFACALLAVAVGCMKLPKGEVPEPDAPDPGGDPVETASYIYPFGEEPQHVTAQIVVSLDVPVDPDTLLVEIPPLKYNKSLLVMLTQDDCRQDAFSTTWAAINGRPLSDTYYYNAVQMRAGDMPPEMYSLGRTLGATDGTGREVRFSFTTALAPEWSFMENVVPVRPGYTGDYYRFFMQPGLVWGNVAEMVNYGVGVALHDMNTLAVSVPDSLVAHFEIAQQLTLDHLNGRGCKMLAEPNGNKAYVEAAHGYAPIQTVVLQTDGEALCPFSVNSDLMKTSLLRRFASAEQMRSEVDAQMQRPEAERLAVCIGVHGTDRSWVDFLSWLNLIYGKDGADCVWMPAHEEYFEYNYMRRNAVVTKRVEDGQLYVTVDMPGGLYFYYPSLTLTIPNLTGSQWSAVDASESVTGLSYAGDDSGLLVNFDCRHALGGLAEHYVTLYEQTPSPANRADARYFVAMLRESACKEALLKRLK